MAALSEKLRIFRAIGGRWAALLEKSLLFWLSIAGNRGMSDLSAGFS
jgi:hypothetical protein